MLAVRIKYTKMQLRLLQVNLNRCRKAMDMLNHICSKERIDIAIVQEPNKNMTKDNIRWITDENINAAFYIANKRMDIKLICEGNGFVEIETSGIKLLSCYISPNCSTQEFERNLTDIKYTVGKMQSAVIGGDFNAKATLWGSEKTDVRGNILTEWLAENDLILANIGGRATFERGSSTSIIDLTLTTKDIHRRLKEWRVSEEENLSDHNNIRYEINITQNEQKTKTEITNKWKYSSQRKEDVINALDKATKTLTKKDSIYRVQTAITKVCKETLTKKHIKGHHPVYWWTKEIDIVRKECIKCRRSIYRMRKKEPDNRLAEIVQEYKTKKSELKKAITLAKAWQTKSMGLSNGRSR